MQNSREDSELLYRVLLAKEKRLHENKWLSYFPDTGDLRRELYQKHLEFFRAGAIHRERLFMAANRVGKTESAGGYETMLHMTGLYPEWWEGKRFSKHISCWMAGTTNITTRDILQAKVCGPINDLGTGLIPKDRFIRRTLKSGVQDAIETIYVKHVSGGTSVGNFKTYEQGRVAFEGTEQDVIWLDEEPPMNVYTECLTRTMTTNGLVMVTFTPLRGISDVVLSFLPSGRLEHE